MLIDTHCHLDMLQEKERELAIKEARLKGVERFVSCSTSFTSNQTNLALSKSNKKVLTAIGLYPLDAVEFSESELAKAFSYFRENISKASAIGEVGLDFKWAKNESEKEKQKKVLGDFIELSLEYKKPLIIHSRYAQRTVLEVLEQKGAGKVLLHSFTDSPKLMKRAVDDNYFVSVGMNLLFSEELQKRITSFPLECLLFETDTPIRFSGEKALPSKVREIAQKVVQLKEITLKDVEKIQEKNFETLFVK